MHARKQRRSFSGLALKLGLLFLCVYLAVSFVCAQMEIAAKRQQLENISQQVAAQQAQNEEIQRTTQADDEASYMERVARDKLGYVRPDERIFIDGANTGG